MNPWALSKWRGQPATPSTLKILNTRTPTNSTFHKCTNQWATRSSCPWATRTTRFSSMFSRQISPCWRMFANWLWTHKSTTNYKAKHRFSQSNRTRRSKKSWSSTQMSSKMFASWVISRWKWSCLTCPCIPSLGTSLLWRIARPCSARRSTSRSVRHQRRRLLARLTKWNCRSLKAQTCRMTFPTVSCKLLTSRQCKSLKSSLCRRNQLAQSRKLTNKILQLLEWSKTRFSCNNNGPLSELLI